MKKILERTNEHSCFNKAKDDEYVFVLRGIDIATPDTIRYWANRRVALGKNTFEDQQISQALKEADEIETYLIQEGKLMFKDQTVRNQSQATPNENHNMTLQVQPDWTRIGTATELEAYMGDNFVITGCGLYLSNTDTILVLGSSTTKWRDITGKLSLYVWNCPLNKTVLGITIPTAQDNRQ